jgi:hypothetical protein
MASILNVDQINNAAGTSAVTIDASTGKPSFPNGAVLPAGSVVQVKQSVKTDTQSISTDFVFTKISGLTVNITPTLANSTFVITASVLANSSYFSYGFLIYKDGSDIGVKGDTENSNTRVAFGGNTYDGNSGNEDYECRMETYTYLYQSTAPAGTPIEFDIYGAPYSSSYTLNINRPADASTSSSRIRGTSTLTVMEIAQ